jgi:hypothetical protein
MLIINCTITEVGELMIFVVGIVAGVSVSSIYTPKTFAR